MHAENLQIQQLSVDKFSQLKDEIPSSNPNKRLLELTLKFAISHKEVIEKCGRFPGR